MKKRFAPFVVPLCDPCSYLEQHSGHTPDSKVRIDHVVISHQTTVGPDGKERTQLSERRDTKYVKYADWDGRCRACVP